MSLNHRQHLVKNCTFTTRYGWSMCTRSPNVQKWWHWWWKDEEKNGEWHVDGTELIFTCNKMQTFCAVTKVRHVVFYSMDGSSCFMTTSRTLYEMHSSYIQLIQHVFNICQVLLSYERVVAYVRSTTILLGCPLTSIRLLKWTGIPQLLRAFQEARGE